jgi:hypothetical protein
MLWPDCQSPVRSPILDPLDSIGVAVDHVIVLIGVTTPWLGVAATWYRQMMVV